MTKHHVIKDIDGNVLYEGRSPTRKAFLKILMRKGVSFARADLRWYDFSHCDLTKLDFSGANLDGANLKGAVADYANFHGASMFGTNAAGLQAKRADFTNVRTGRDTTRKNPTIFHHAVLSYSKWDGSDIAYTEFDHAAMSMTTLVGVSASKASFREAVMNNADFVESSLTSCDFSNSTINSTLNINAKHLPDRTLNATLYGNKYDGAQIGEGYSQFQYDRKWNGVSTHLMWAAPTLAGGLLLDYLTGGGLSALNMAAEYSGLVGSGFVSKITGGAVVVSAGMLVKSKVEDYLKDQYATMHSKVNLTLRRGIAEVIKRGHNLAQLCVLFTKPDTRDLISKYTRNAGETFLKKFKAAFDGELEVIICDRKNLSEALSKMCDTMVNRAPPDRKVVITRLEDKNDNGPKTFILNPDGTSEAFWSHPQHGEAYVRWDKYGARITPSSHARLKASDGERNDAIKLFMNLMIIDHGLGEFDFNPETHTIRVGRDKSAVVTNRSDGRIMNRLGPIILPMEGDPIYTSDKIYDLSDIREAVLTAEMESSRLLGGNDNRADEQNFAEDLEEAASSFRMSR